MQDLFIGISKYLFVIIMSFFVLFSFIIMRDRNRKTHPKALSLQTVMIFLFHLIAYIVIFMNIHDNTIILFYGAQIVMFIVFRKIYDVLYEDNYSRGLINNMCMLLCISFIMLTRLYYNMAIKQFAIVSVSVILSFFVTFIVKRFRRLPDLTYLYCFTGIAFLLGVLILGQTTKGANLSISVAGFAFQPSEFVKILYVFFLAAFLSKNINFRHILISAIFAGVHVIILVLSKDLGSALIFFIVYVVMVYVATGKVRYMFAGMAGGVIAALVSYKIFPHVRVRVTAYRNPWAVIDGAGYQVSQSLFAIGTGGFLGLGLYKGAPKSIPLVEQDFMFSAIVEEFGGFFGICLIFLCISCFLYFIKSALRQKKMFYKLVGLGMSISYAVQTILTIGGALKFIPSTGVTLPLVSYGGSSVLCTMIVFAILQGLYVIYSEDEEKLRMEAEQTEVAHNLAVTAGIDVQEVITKEMTATNVEYSEEKNIDLIAANYTRDKNKRR